MHPARVRRDQLHRLTDLPNVGPATAADLKLIGIHKPDQLVGQNPRVLFENLCRASGVRQDPCVLDVFISITRFMDGEAPRAWWDYTAERKRMPGVAPRQRFGRERAALHGLDSLNCPTHAA